MKRLRLFLFLEANNRTTIEDKGYNQLLLLSFLFFNSGKNVAIKVQNLKEITTNEKDINQEYRTLRNLSSHPNMTDFYGAFTNKNGTELWFVMEVHLDCIHLFYIFNDEYP